MNNGEETSSKGSSTATTPSTDRKTCDESTLDPVLNLTQIDDKLDPVHYKTIENKLNLNMTAKELRAQLASRKKYDPKKDCLDIQEKYEIVQKL